MTGSSSGSGSGVWFRLVTLFLLYLVQGAPYGFQTACLPIALRAANADKKAGLSFSALGALRLLFLPWVLKPLYAHIIEDTKSKQWWLILSMSGMAISCLLAGFFTSEDDLMPLAALLLALNLFSASQDVATDSLAVRILKPEELGVGNTVQVVAYKAGSVFAGGLLLWVMDRFGWTIMFFSFASVYVVGMGLLTALDLVNKSTGDVETKAKGDIKEQKKDLSPWKAINEIFSVEGTSFLVAFILFYKLCERAEMTFSIYMVDKAVPKSIMALWATILRSVSLLGSSYAGWVLSRSQSGVEHVTLKAKRLLVRHSLFRVFPIIGQLIILIFWGYDPVKDPETTLYTLTDDALMMYLGFGCTCVTLFAAGVITTATFTLMMSHSQEHAPKHLQGTHYSSLATFEILGKLMFAGASGVLTDLFGLETMFISYVILAVMTVPFAHSLPERRISQD